MEGSLCVCVKTISACIDICSDRGVRSLCEMFRLNSQDELNYFLEICKKSKEGDSIFTNLPGEQVPEAKTLKEKMEELGWETRYENIFFSG